MAGACQCQSETVDLSNGCVKVQSSDASHQFAAFTPIAGYELKVNWHKTREAAKAAAGSGQGEQFVVHIGDTAGSDGLLSPSVVKVCAVNCLPAVTVCPDNLPPVAIFAIPATANSGVTIPLVSASTDPDSDSLTCTWAIVS